MSFCYNTLSHITIICRNTKLVQRISLGQAYLLKTSIILQFYKTVLQLTTYLILVSSEHIDHHLHHCLVHAQDTHQIWMLVKHFVVHNVPE